jgi:chromosome segregation ATPase
MDDTLATLSSYDFEDLENKLVRQMEIIGIVLEGLQTGAGLEWVAEAEMRLDSLLVGEHPDSVLNLDEMINKIDKTVSNIKSELVHVESTALLDKVEMIQRILKQYKVVSETSSFSTLSILVASLLATIKQTKEVMASSATKYESEIKELMADLEKSHNLLDLRGEQTQIHDNQLALLKSSEASLLKAVDELRSALNSASEEFAKKMKDQQKLYKDDRNHYEEIIAGLEKQIKKTDEVRRTEIEKEELENQLKLSQEQAKQLQAKLASYRNEMQSLITEMQETQERKDNEHEQLVAVVKEALGRMADIAKSEETALQELLNSKQQTQNLIESTIKSIN